MAFTTQDIHRVLLVDSNGDPLIVAGQDLATAAKQDTQITSLASLLTGMGAVADAAVTNPALSASEIALLKGLLTFLAGTGANAINMQGAGAQGAVPAGKPLLAGIYDGTNVQYLRGETNGQVRVSLYSASGSPAGVTSLGSIDTNSTATIAVPAGSFNLVYDALAANWERLRVCNVFKQVATVAIGAIATVWTPAAGKKFNLMGGFISVSAAVSVLFEDNAAASFVYQTPMLEANKPYFFTVGGANSNGIVSAAANNVLKATASGAANLLGTLFGTEE